MELLDTVYTKFTNPILIENLSKVSFAFLLAFVITILLVPVTSRLAIKLNAVDLPAKLRKKADKTASRRIHDKIIPKLPGLAMLVAILISLYATQAGSFLPKGIILGMILITCVGALDDIFNVNGRVLLLGQIIVASSLVISGNTILNIDLGFVNLDLNMFSDLIFQFSHYSYNFIFPADIITILWIVGLINAVNWVDGADGVLGSVGIVSGLAMLMIVLNRDDPNIVLATIIAVYTGSVLGVLPFNYNPAKVFYASTGSYLIGYTLAVFAIFGSARWTATIIILGLPILDALLVVIIRLKENKEARRNPLMLLSISDKNHLHHRLLASGYPVKMVMLIELSLMMILGVIAFGFSDIEGEYFATFAGIAFIVVTFTIIAFLKKRRSKRRARDRGPEIPPGKEPIVNVLVDENGSEDYEKFIY